MTLSEKQARAVFGKLEEGDGTGFFDHVAEEVDWSIEGSHPLAGRYLSRDELREGAFDPLTRVLLNGPGLSVEKLLVSGDWAIVELATHATSRAGMEFDNCGCWLCRFERNEIVEARAYVDSALVQRLFDEDARSRSESEIE